MIPNWCAQFVPQPSPFIHSLLIRWPIKLADLSFHMKHAGNTVLKLDGRPQRFAPQVAIQRCCGSRHVIGRHMLLRRVADAAPASREVGVEW